jgi:hypothetical protein
MKELELELELETGATKALMGRNKGATNKLFNTTTWLTNAFILLRL